MYRNLIILITLTFFPISGNIDAAKLVKMKVVDKDYLMIYFVDGEVNFVDNGKGLCAYNTHCHDTKNNFVTYFGKPLDVKAALRSGNFLITSANDPQYSGKGKSPEACHLKSKLNGMAEKDWHQNDYVYEHTMEHTVWLKLPHSLKQGKSYTIRIDPVLNSDVSVNTFLFDIFSCPTEAIHLNLVGFTASQTRKAADLYMWMGDGGARDYSSFIGKKVFIYDVEKKTSQQVGKVTFGKKNNNDVGGYDLSASDIWLADFEGYFRPGKYKLAIEDVGCSEEFEIRNDIYFEPFRVSTLGFFYMRIGQDNLDMTPVPRRPLYIPYVSPAETRIFITSMSPYHPSWKTFSSGDVWDRPTDWAAFKKEGLPENKHAVGGHSDALDWDRHLGHVSIIYDMLLPYILTGGKMSDDNLGIAESGNGIPDIIDEARNEVDFWLSLRHGMGYSHGLTNPDKQSILYQADNTPIAAWANAANSAMLSYCFYLAGNKKLCDTYRDSAIAAYRYASALPNLMLDTLLEVGQAKLSGRDLKMMAAGYLYNVTGDENYEVAFKESFRAGSATLPGISGNSGNQLWAATAYLKTHQKVNYPELLAQLKNIIIKDALEMEVKLSEMRPSRRATEEGGSYFKTIQNVHRTLVAHAITTDATQKEKLLNTLLLEADWGLGRNSANIIYMTTASTALASKRSIENAYTSGRNDGTPGLHPGHTPYINTEDWAPGMIMGRPSWMYSKCYPDYTLWPKAEGYFNTRYVWAHSEFTPQQTMRGKMALYGYLYGIFKE